MARAKYVGLWYGGANYACPDPARDLERFASLRAARDTLQARADNDDGRTPCANDGGPDNEPEIHLYRGRYDENGPDYVVSLGPRGGVRHGRA